MLFFITTALAGTLAESTTWTADHSPVHLDEDLVVPVGLTLSIEPGVSVDLAPGVSLYVDGALIARGNADAPVVFSGSDWGALVFGPDSEPASFTDLDDYAGGSILERCVVEGGERAVQLLGASPYIVDSEFRDNHYTPELTAGGAALLITEGSTARVRGNQFTGNTVGGKGYGGAIYIEGAEPILQGNHFTGNTSAYGGAVCQSISYSPIVGNSFVANDSIWDGGAASLLSASPAFLNNELLENTAVADGGGVHVCVTCYPHATPSFYDNVIVGNSNFGLGSGGVGAAYLRNFEDNDLHDNTTAGEPSNFAWFNEGLDDYPEHVVNPQLRNNWWGSSDEGDISRSIIDGEDEEDRGLVSVQPADGPVAEARVRAVITHHKLRYEFEGEDMAGYLTLYNPGEARQVELLLLLQVEDGPPLPWRGELDYPGATRQGDRLLLDMPADSVWFGTPATVPFAVGTDIAELTWHALVFDADTGERLSSVSSATITLGGA